MEASTGKATRVNPKGILVTIIIILLCALSVLLYLYFRLVQPPQAKTKAGTPGIAHIFSIYGSPEDKLRGPRGLGVDADGNVYIADSANNRVVVYDAAGQRVIRTIVIKEADSLKAAELLANQYKDKLRKSGKNDAAKSVKVKDFQHQKFNYGPRSVAVAEDGRIFVAAKGRVLVYSAGGEELKDVKFKSSPICLTIAGDRLYIGSRDTLSIFTLAMKPVSQWVRWGKKAGEYDAISGIAVAADGTIYISELLNNRMQALSKKGEPLWAIGRPAKSMKDSTVTFDAPAGIALGADGNIYMLDAFTSTIHVFDKKGKKLGTAGALGQKDGQFNMPGEIRLVRDDVFVVADTFNDRVQELSIGLTAAAAK